MENKPTPQSHFSSGFFGIIKESFKTTIRNVKLLGPLLFLVFVYFSQIDFLQKYILARFVKEYVSQFSDHQNIAQGFIYSVIDDGIIYTGALKEVRVIVLVKLIIMVISFIIILTFSVAVICASSASYTSKVLDTKEFNSTFIKCWKRPLATNFYMILITLGTVFLYLISMTITTILVVDSWKLMFIGAITISYSYLVALWIVSVVVSVLEEDCGGIKAIARATELMKGKRLQASLMMILFAVAYGVVTWYNLSMSTQSIGIPITNGLYALLTLFIFVVYTIFYHEWETCHDHEKEDKIFYLPIAVGDA